jgi:hypothetical protein
MNADNWGVHPFGETVRHGDKDAVTVSPIIVPVRTVQSFTIGIPVKRRRALLASNPIEE